MKALLMAAALVGCGSHTIAFRNSAIKPYADQFYADAKRYGIKAREANVSYHIIQPPIHKDMPKAVGVCFYGEVSSFILISRAYWRKATPNERKALVYHELAHCALSLKHTKNPQALMYPTVHSPLYLEANIDRMIEEFFEGIGK